MNEYAEIAESLPDPFRILWRARVGSTNDELGILARQGCGEGLTLIAEEQSAGRGRRGAPWLCEPGNGLAFSILLRPKVEKELWYRHSLIAGLAVAEAFDGLGLDGKVKWPNDVLIGGEKVCGILVETGDDHLIIGIGINVNGHSFPAELGATSLELALGERVERAGVLAGVVGRLAVHRGFVRDNFGGIIRRIRMRCALTGREVRMKSGGGEIRGIVRGIGGDGELLLESSGELKRISHADGIRIIKKPSVEEGF